MYIQLTELTHKRQAIIPHCPSPSVDVTCFSLDIAFLVRYKNPGDQGAPL